LSGIGKITLLVHSLSYEKNKFPDKHYPWFFGPSQYYYVFLIKKHTQNEKKHFETFYIKKLKTKNKIRS